MANHAELVPKIDRIHLSGLLSFGPWSAPFELRNLNVLIGANGSGKSNLIEAVALLRSLPDSDDFAEVLRKGGGVKEWLWKHPDGLCPVAGLKTRLSGGDLVMDHGLLVGMMKDATRAVILEEGIDSYRARYGADSEFVGESQETIFKRGLGATLLDRREQSNGPMRSIDLAPDASVLAQVSDPGAYPEISGLAASYRAIRLYREWTFGPNSPLRNVARTDLPDDAIAENFSNLPLVLRRLGRTPKVKNKVLQRMGDLYPRFTSYEVLPLGDSYCELRFTEGDLSIPAQRLSDGTLRYLCLVALLTDPEPPPLICLEEPEIGLHPDVVVKLADMLVDASSRTRLIVTTHSDTLVDALTDHPESIVICENKGGSTTLERLDPERMEVWLEKYSLGTLWTDGELGGNRW